MPIQIEQIKVMRGQSICLLLDGSVENSLWVFVDEKGFATMQGPLNTRRKTFSLTIRGIKEVGKNPLPKTYSALRGAK